MKERGGGSAAGAPYGPDGTKRRRMKGERRRTLIAEAAVEVFAERGYDSVNMEDIASRAGVSRPVLYDHFASKKELYLYLLHQQRDQVVAYVQGVSGKTPSLEGRIRAAIDGFFAYVEAHPTTWRLLFSDLGGDQEIAPVQDAIRREADLLMFQHLFGDGAALKRLTPEQRHVLPHFWGSACKGVARWWYQHPEISRGTLVDTAMTAFWTGLQQMSRREVGSKQARRSGFR